MADDPAIGPDGYLDMTRFPDGDPDTVLSFDEATALRTVLLDDPIDEPDAATWQVLFDDVVSGEQGDAEADDARSDDAGTGDLARPDDLGGWGIDVDVDVDLDLDHDFHHDFDPELDLDSDAGHDQGGGDVDFGGS